MAATVVMEAAVDVAKAVPAGAVVDAAKAADPAVRAAVQGAAKFFRAA